MGYYYSAIVFVLLINQAFAAVSSVDQESYGDVLLERSRRDVSNYDLVDSHSICRSKSDKATESGVTDADKKLIVDLHNRLRSEVVPTASNMLKMRWDDEVALIAQKWADNCDLNHDENKQRNIPARFGIGQNLAMGARNFESAINLWQSEKTVFKYGSTNDLHAVGHYTQVNWATTNIIGCGFAKCGTTNYHVCNYAVAGNSQSQLGFPYKQGTPCADCPGHCDASGKLCDCSNTCWNGATMNMKTCTCECLNDMYIQPNCKLDCDRSEPSTGGYSCSGAFGQSLDCNSFAKYCPLKCNFCPAADYRVVEKAFAPCNSGTNNIIYSIHFIVLNTFVGLLIALFMR